jgi:hypothetical protein
MKGTTGMAQLLQEILRSSFVLALSPLIKDSFPSRRWIYMSHIVPYLRPSQLQIHWYESISIPNPFPYINNNSSALLIVCNFILLRRTKTSDQDGMHSRHGRSPKHDPILRKSQEFTNIASVVLGNPTALTAKVVEHVEQEEIRQVGTTMLSILRC